MLLTKYLGGHKGTTILFEAKKDPIHWPFPMSIFRLRPQKADTIFLARLKAGALQYAIIQPLCSIVSILMGIFQTYQNGNVNLSGGYVYIVIVTNFSQMVSLYSLVWFYIIMKEPLTPFGPIYKFLSVKLVVFATFWQGIGLSVLAYFGIIHNGKDFNVGQIETGMQDFLVCLEMFLASVAHFYAFPPDPYIDGSNERHMKEVHEKIKTEIQKQGTQSSMTSSTGSGITDSTASLSPPANSHNFSPAPSSQNMSSQVNLLDNHNNHNNHNQSSSNFEKAEL